MVTRELLHSEIDHLDEQYLEKAYKLIKELTKSKKKAQTKSSVPILLQLQSIKMDGPEDLSTNHDLYVTGEKTFD
jgi:hypothetical protein